MAGLICYCNGIVRAATQPRRAGLLTSSLIPHRAITRNDETNPR